MIDLIIATLGIAASIGFTVSRAVAIHRKRAIQRNIRERLRRALRSSYYFVDHKAAAQKLRHPQPH